MVYTKQAVGKMDKVDKIDRVEELDGPPDTSTVACCKPLTH